MTDESMSVLLPSAQEQKVMLLGGGNIDYAIPATRLTDLVDLASASPRYGPGPPLPRGKLYILPSAAGSSLPPDRGPHG